MEYLFCKGQIRIGVAQACHVMLISPSIRGLHHAVDNMEKPNICEMPFSIRICQIYLPILSLYVVLL